MLATCGHPSRPLEKDEALSARLHELLESLKDGDG
jgi:hypothetical protein